MSSPVGILLEMRETIWTMASYDAERIEDLSRCAGVPPIIARLLIRRGIETPEEASRFFRAREGELFDPSLLKGMDETVDRLVTAARNGRRIVVFGDYDVDGVTAVAQLKAALLRAGADAVAFLPHRLRDGYGLKPETVRRILSERRPDLIITVDCGIGAVEGVACARSAGVDVIVTDHHLVPDQLPAGAIVINPKQPGCPSPYKDLAACGIALKIAQAVVRRSGSRLSLESLLRAASLGTIADLVPLTGENRTIATAGLALLAAPRSPGLRSLLTEAGVGPGRAPSSEEIAFRVAPRLNAAGRLDTAHLALALFEEREDSKGASIARELSRRNSERQSIERRVTAEARERIGPSPEDRILVLGDSTWHRGVLGIAAARLAREYHRPVLLFALEEGRATGSGRSIPGVSLHDILRSLAHFFAEFGGHDQAVGASLPITRFSEFGEAARAVARERVPEEKLAPLEEADAELDPSEVGEELLGWLSRLEPHGMGNPRPIFHASRGGLTGSLRALGDRGMRGQLARSGEPLDFVCWDPTALDRSGHGSPIDFRYRLRPGRLGRPEAEIVSIRASGTGAR